jgi:hypothetical protein
VEYESSKVSPSYPKVLFFNIRLIKLILYWSSCDILTLYILINIFYFSFVNLINILENKIIDKGTIKAAPNFVAKSTKDTKRLAYLQQIAKNKGVDSAAALQNGAELGSISVPPNFNLPNQSNIKKENGLIIFGGDVTGAGTKGTVTPVSRTTVVNKINGTA